MYDKELVISMLEQIGIAIDKISYRFESINTPDDFTHSPWGMEKLDSICMLLLAIGESLKLIDKITENKLLEKYTNVNFKGIKGLRDIISHHYFDIDAEQIFWICDKELRNLKETIIKISEDLLTA